VVVSSNIIKTLEEREWIRVVGYRDVPGKPALFGTTRAFLDYFNLKSLDELPPLSEIRDMEDPQLRFAEEPMPVRVARDLPIDPDAEAQEAEAAESGEPAAETADGGSESGAEGEAEFHVAGERPDEGNAAVAEPPHEHDDAAVEAAASHAGGDDPAEPSTLTAVEAENEADAGHGDATKDTEEYRA
jgi:segregation and condensation protein B